MAGDFLQDVQAVIGPFLSDLGFTSDGVDSAVNEGGPKGSVAYYRGQDCKIQVYHSSREGEINAMIAPLDAPNEYGLYNGSGKWHYFNDFTDIPDLPLEELVRKLRAERANFETTPERLEWLKRRIARDFDSARTAIVEGR
ncbi:MULTISPECIES: hypothetical protein [Mycobacterium]|uniref:hypothetical protein n=1 Tax=Mycobacterium TaxID=1763 RepID=UPI00084904E7|nr:MULTISPECIES: hypothetical protein [Mycobacterium]MCV7260997.1 hypothetical protein [Mycobacterium shimoidei]ODR13589.1 hypothetical protein BHQ16_09615 [Mycobacterium shimoidei]ORW76498.1 hypothetical protein AWC26_20855 [Mycobacterium shimoidei]